MVLSRYMRRLLGPTVLAHVIPALAWICLTHSGLVGAFVLVFGTACFVPVTNAYLRGERRRALEVALIDTPYFVHWVAGLIALPIALVAVVVELAVDAARHTIAFPSAAFIGAYGLALSIATYGTVIRRRLVQTQRIEIPIDTLPASFDGYRIVQLSDMHIGAWTPKAWGMRWARAANALDADLVVVTGDMVANGTTFHEDIADVIGALRAKDGVVVSMGNHDYFGNAEPLVTMLRARGVRVLRNESEHIVRGDAHIVLAAIDDRWSRRANLDEALRAWSPGEAIVLLAHDPVDFPKAAARGVDLVLSGHTHGGQIALPLFAREVNHSRFSRKHTLGLYTEGRSRLIVHPGLGTSGPPVRIGVAPALVEITLRAVDHLTV
jgi:predicted MPP superfamily phosphohydrolase